MHSLKRFLIVFAVALVIFAICGYFVTGLVTKSLQTSIEGTDKPAVVTTEAVTAQPGLAPVPENLGGNSFNVLLIGTDYRPSLLSEFYHPGIASQYPMFEDSGALLGVDGRLPEQPYRPVYADAVMLLCVNKEAQRVTYVQIPSEAILTVRGAETTVGELYYDRGLSYFTDKMAALTGVSIDYYAVIGIEDIGNLVSALGGVHYTVPCDMAYTDEVSGLSISLSAGTKNLSAEDVMALLSFRDYTSPTLSRAYTAMSFLKALAQKLCAVTNLPRASELYQTVADAVYTNFTAEDLAANAELIFAYNSFTIKSVDYPTSGAFHRDGERYVIPDITSAIRKIQASV